MAPVGVVPASLCTQAFSIIASAAFIASGNRFLYSLYVSREMFSQMQSPALFGM